jgi:hypothetical protein
VQRKKAVLKRLLTILASYSMAAYIEAVSWRLYALLTGEDPASVLSVKPMLILLISPLAFPAKYAVFFHVRTPGEFASVFAFYFASLVTFAAAFIGAYLVIRSNQRRRESVLRPEDRP